MVVPAASTEVPDTDETVVAVQYDPVIAGVKVVVLEPDITVRLLEAIERQLVPEMALAVIT